MVSLYTICAWGGLILVCSGYYYLGQKKPRRPSKQKEVRERIKKEKDVKSRKLKSTGGESSGNEAQKRVKTKKEPVEPAPVISYDNIADDKVDDKEFARQFSNAKAGTSMAPKNESASRQKSVKLSKAMTSDDDATMRKPNGDHVSDGDDDLSSAASPEFNATVLGSRDPSDMLENTTTGPSVLRLTPSSKPTKPKPAPKQATPEPTKKQRQNAAKAQQAKLQREEDEKERRVLLEKQRRTAREAEGRAAKDGSSTIYTPPPSKTSAWDNSQHASPQALLDTLASPIGDNSGKDSRKESRKENLPATASKPQAPLAEWSDLPSEEEQMRMLSEDSGWNEVKAKKSKGKLTRATSEAVAGKLSTL